MMFLPRNASLKLTIRGDDERPTRWEVWPEIARLEISEDGRTATATFKAESLGMGRCTVLAHQPDGKPSRYFYLTAVDPEQSPC